MHYLFDTHTLLWLLSGNKNLSQKVKFILAEKELVKFISVVSLWEIAVKVSLGKLEIDHPVDVLPNLIIEKGYFLLPVNHHHAVGLASLPLLHRDPFDRMLVSQALSDRLTILTRDDLIKQYTVPVVW